MKKKAKWYHFRWRMALLCLLIITVFVGCIGCRLYNAIRVRPIGTGPAGPVVAAEPFEKAWMDGPVVFLGVGDSITRGYGAPGGLTYFDLLEQNHAKYP
ncbi:MAG: hypothetical protein ACYTER_11700, partial [Planctomycetota bacterium]